MGSTAAAAVGIRLAAMTVLTVAVMTACTASTAPSAEATAVRSCRAAAPPSLDWWTRQWTQVPGWHSGDVAFSAALPDGRTIFSFGDSATTRSDGGRQFVHNAFVAYAGGHPARPGGLVKVSGDQELIPNRPDGSFYWAGAMVYDAGRLWVFTTRVVADSSAGFGFRVLGQELAEVRVPACGRPVFVGMHKLPSSDRGEADGVSWNSAVRRSSDGYLYVYGARRPAGEFGNAVHVARVPHGSLADLAAWRYWDGTDWAAAESGAAPVIDAAGGTDSGFSVQQVGDQVVLVSKVGGAFGGTIAAWRAATWTGPFTAPEPLVDGVGWGNGRQTYLAAAHDLRLADGGWLVGMSTNLEGAAFADFWDRPEIYRPMWFTVDLRGAF